MYTFEEFLQLFEQNKLGIQYEDGPAFANICKTIDDLGFKDVNGDFDSSLKAAEHWKDKYDILTADGREIVFWRRSPFENIPGHSIIEAAQIDNGAEGELDELLGVTL